MVIVVCTGFSSQMVVPIWVGQVIDTFHVSATTAGSIASLEFITVAVTSLGIATLIGLVPGRRLCIAGTTLLLAGNLVSMLAMSLPVLTAARLVCGVGKGLVVAIIFGLAGQTANPTRSFAVLNCGYAGFSAAIFLIVPLAVEHSGIHGAFGSMAALSVIGAALLPWIPEASPRTTQTSWFRGLPLQSAGLLTAASLAVLFAAHGGIWTFIERIGIRDGLDLRLIGVVLSAGSALAIGGPLLSHVLEIKRGALRPILAALLVLSVTAACLCMGSNRVGYMLAAPLYSLSALFLVPYIQGLLSFADPSGKLNASSSAFMTLGGSVAPLISGSLIDRGGYTALGGATFFLFALAFALLWPAASRHDSRLRIMAQAPAAAGS
jgi:predicted MFS family arabinose efflux permease